MKAVRPPKRENVNSYKAESFESYYSRWPCELANVPEDVVRQWVYYHNEIFWEDRIVYEIEKWKFELKKFTNDEILEILHYPSEIEHMDKNGDILMQQGMPGYDTAEYMLEYGTFPCPIIVARNAGAYKHIKSIGNETMLEPYHLVEGHRRLGFVRGMIKHGYEKLKLSHEVWLTTIT